CLSAPGPAHARCLATARPGRSRGRAAGSRRARRAASVGVAALPDVPRRGGRASRADGRRAPPRGAHRPASPAPHPPRLTASARRCVRTIRERGVFVDPSILACYPSPMPRQPATVTVDVETCKGCVLCVEVCPPRVLVMSETANRMGYRYPLLLDGCTGC